MGAPVLHEAYPAKFVYAGPTTLYINQLDQVDVQPGIEVIEAMAAGSLDPQLIATAFAEPKVDFTSRDLATVLAGLSIYNGRDVTTSGTIQWEKRLDGGAYTSSTTHMNLVSTGGLLYAKEFSAKQDDKEGASISLTFCPRWDGTNLPLVVNNGVALAGTPAANAVHALGPVIFEGAQLDGIQSVSVKTGIEVAFKRHSGELYSRVVTIIKRKPTIEIELNNNPFAGTLTLGGTYAISTGIVAYFQKVTPGGGRVAIGTAEHVSAGTTTGAYRLDSISGSKGEHATVKMTVIPTGTLSMSAATAITIP